MKIRGHTPIRQRRHRLMNKRTWSWMEERHRLELWGGEESPIRCMVLRCRRTAGGAPSCP